MAVGPAGSSLSAAGRTLTETYSWEPWYPPSNLAILCLPVKALAALRAMRVPSVPELAKRTESTEGSLSHNALAMCACIVVGTLKAVPLEACC